MPSSYAVMDEEITNNYFDRTDSNIMKLVNYVKNIILVLVHIATFMDVCSSFFVGEYVDDFVSLFILLIELIAVLNLTDTINKKNFIVSYSLLWIILIARLNILNDYVLPEASRVAGIIFIGVSMFYSFHVLKNADVKKTDINTTTDNINISEQQIQSYVKNRILSWFQMAYREKNDGTSKYLWFAFSGLIAVVMYLGKFIIDIINMFASEYSFGMVTISVYLILSVAFIVVNIIKADKFGDNRMSDILESIMFLLGANLFVFAQREHARFQILVLAAYLCSLYVIRMKRQGERLL